MRAKSARAVPFIALAVVSLGAIAFDLTLPLRLPASGDYAEAAGYLRSHIQHGDAIQIWPPWLEQARLFIDSGPDAGPLSQEEDLQHADYPGAARLWLLALPGSPFSGFSKAEGQLRARGAAPVGDAMHFGPLSLADWDLKAPPLAADLIFPAGAREFHEVQYIPHACRMMPVGGEANPARVAFTGAAGKTLHLRAGIEGEAAYDAQLTPIRVEAFINGTKLAELTLTRTHDPDPAWRGAEVPSGNAPDLQLELRASTQGSAKPGICVAAWTTR